MQMLNDFNAYYIVLHPFGLGKTISALRFCRVSRTIYPSDYEFSRDGIDPDDRVSSLDRGQQKETAHRNCGGGGGDRRVCDLPVAPKSGGGRSQRGFAQA